MKEKKTKSKKYDRKLYEKYKPYYQKYMKEYYKKYKEEIKENSKIYRSTKKKQRSYNKPLKNKIRENIIEIISRYKIKNVLTLESPRFLFSKEIPEKKVIVFENNKKQYEKMSKTKPKNVSLFFGEVSRFSDLNAQADFIYLDFCKTFQSCKEIIFQLKESIRKSKLFAITFSLRGGFGDLEEGDYQFKLINQIQELTGINLKVLYGEGYSDGTPMVTIVFENNLIET